MVQSTHPIMYKLDLAKCPKLHANFAARDESMYPQEDNSGEDVHDPTSEQVQEARRRLDAVPCNIGASHVAGAGSASTAHATGAVECRAPLPLRARGPYARAAS